MEVKVGKVYVNDGMWAQYVLVLAVANRFDKGEVEEKTVIYKNLKNGELFEMSYSEFTKPIKDPNGIVVGRNFKMIRDELAIARKLITKKELKLFEKVAGFVSTKENQNKVDL